MVNIWDIFGLVISLIFPEVEAPKVETVKPPLAGTQEPVEEPVKAR